MCGLYMPRGRGVQPDAATAIIAGDVYVSAGTSTLCSGAPLALSLAVHAEGSRSNQSIPIKHATQRNRW